MLSQIDTTRKLGVADGMTADRWALYAIVVCDKTTAERLRSPGVDPNDEVSRNRYIFYCKVTAWLEVSRVLLHFDEDGRGGPKLLDLDAFVRTYMDIRRQTAAIIRIKNWTKPLQFQVGASNTTDFSTMA